MATAVFTTCPPLWPPSWIFKNFIFRKTATNFTGISIKHMFFSLKYENNRKYSQKEEFTTNFPKILQFSILNFDLHN